MIPASRTNFLPSPAFDYPKLRTKDIVTLNTNWVRSPRTFLAVGWAPFSPTRWCPAVFHEHGRGGCKRNDVEAVSWYTKAAEQGHTAAESSLGRLFLVGAQIQQDVAKAVHFLQRAAAKVRSRPCTISHLASQSWSLVQNDSSAQTRLGLLYTTGNGVKQDVERGVAFLQSVRSPILITGHLK